VGTVCDRPSKGAVDVLQFVKGGPLHRGVAETGLKLFFRPSRAASITTRHPRLAPWAGFLRRFAAVAPAIINDSDLSHAAVDVDFYAGDVGGVLRSQERDRGGHFFGLPEALHWNFGNDFLGEFINRFLG
jgi:hypothetical protein